MAKSLKFLSCKGITMMLTMSFKSLKDFITMTQITRCNWFLRVTQASTSLKWSGHTFVLSSRSFHRSAILMMELLSLHSLAKDSQLLYSGWRLSSVSTWGWTTLTSGMTHLPNTVKRLIWKLDRSISPVSFGMMSTHNSIRQDLQMEKSYKFSRFRILSCGLNTNRRSKTGRWNQVKFLTVSDCGTVQAS